MVEGDMMRFSIMAAASSRLRFSIRVTAQFFKTTKFLFRFANLPLVNGGRDIHRQQGSGLRPSMDSPI